MKSSKIAILAALAIGVLVAFGFVLRGALHRRAANPQTDLQPATAANREATPADTRLQAAQQAIAQSPNKPEGYNLLASAFMQKARETGDFGFNARAEGALARSLEVRPGHARWIPRGTTQTRSTCPHHVRPLPQSGAGHVRIRALAPSAWRPRPRAHRWAFGT